MMEFNLNKPYSKVALYLEDADSIEYIRVDKPSISERIDEHLTMVLDMETEEAIGFRLKGFKNIYLNDRAEQSVLGTEFYSLVGLLERSCKSIGDDRCPPSMIRDAYLQACRMALADGVELSDLPKVA